MIIAPMFMLFLLASLLLFETTRRCIIWLKRRYLIKTAGCKPPRSLPQSDNLLGLDTLKTSWSHFQDDSYLSLSQSRFRKYGNTFQFLQLGSILVNTIEPENIQTILSTRFQDFALGKRRRTAFEALIGRGIFTTDGPSWEHSRKLIRPAFAKNELEDLSGLEQNVQSLLSQITDHPLNLQPKFLMLTINFATRFLFGDDRTSLNSSKSAVESERFGAAFDRAQRAITKFFVLGPFSTFASGSQFKYDREVVSSFVDRYIERAVSRPLGDKKGKYSFLNELSKHTQDKSLLRGSLLNMLLAGRDTTASLLSNLWFILARRPDVYQKLQEEIKGLGGRVPTRDDLKTLTYLRCCLDESLRLHPPIPRNSRTAVRDTILPVGGGEDGKSPVFVRKGTQVGYQAFSMHRRTDIWGQDSENFVPERWIEMRNYRPCWEYIPFSRGPRICPGQQLALIEASYVTARLLQNFEHVESVDRSGIDLQNDLWRESLGLTCSTANGTWVHLTRD